MTKAKGKPENFNNPPSRDLTNTITFRCTEEMKKEVKTQDDPGQFCRDAIQKALDEKKEKNK